MTTTSPPDLGALARGLLRRGLLGPDDLVDPALPPRLGRYEVVRPLGRGVHGLAALAKDPVLGREVAIKLLDRLPPPKLERFQRDVRRLVALRHPAIATVLDCGSLGEDRPFLVMEWIDQPTLRDRWPERDAALEAIEAVARACHVAHEAGVVHLALEPSHILVGARTVVVDLGVAAATGAREAALNAAPEYFAPEQVSQGGLGPATDVWALGAILYEALAGVPPFEADDAADVVRKIVTASPAPPRALDPSVPAALEAVALQALSKDPQRRWSSAAAFADALAAARRPVGRRPRPHAAAAPAARSSWLPWVAGGVGVAAIGWIASRTLTSPPAPPPAPPPQAPSPAPPTPAPAPAVTPAPVRPLEDRPPVDRPPEDRPREDRPPEDWPREDWPREAPREWRPPPPPEGHRPPPDGRHGPPPGEGPGQGPPPFGGPGPGGPPPRGPGQGQPPPPDRPR